MIKSEFEKSGQESESLAAQEVYNKYLAECLLLSPDDTVTEVTSRLDEIKMNEYIVIPPFSNLEQLTEILRHVGTQYELRFEVVVPEPDMCDSSAIFHYSLDSHTVTMRIMTPNPKKHYMLDEDAVSEQDYTDQAQVEELLRKVRMIANPEQKDSVIVITKGDSQMTGATVKASYFDSHSHPTDSTIRSSLVDRRQSSKRVIETYTNRIIPTPGLQRSNKRNWRNLLNIFS